MSAYLAYLASPYAAHSGGTAAAYAEVCKLAARLLKAGVTVFSPIAHSHGIAVWGSLNPIDHDIWIPFDKLIMARCDALIVAHMPGWRESKGMAIEIAFFEAARKPIFDLNPESLTMARR